MAGIDLHIRFPRQFHDAFDQRHLVFIADFFPFRKIPFGLFVKIQKTDHYFTGIAF